MTTIEGNTYTIRTSQFNDDKVLLKNDKPVLTIPKELEEDFIKILVYAGATNKFLNEKTK